MFIQFVLVIRVRVMGVEILATCLLPTAAAAAAGAAAAAAAAALALIVTFDCVFTHLWCVRENTSES